MHKVGVGVIVVGPFRGAYVFLVHLDTEIVEAVCIRSGVESESGQQPQVSSMWLLVATVTRKCSLC
jgi:hypothetical protein